MPMRPGYRKALAVFPSDTLPLAPGFVLGALYIGGGGDLVVRVQDCDLILSVPAGTTIPIAPSHVLARGTTATQIVALGD